MQLLLLRRYLCNPVALSRATLAPRSCNGLTNDGIRATRRGSIQVDQPFNALLLMRFEFNRIALHCTITTYLEGVAGVGSSGPRTLEIVEARIENISSIP